MRIVLLVIVLYTSAAIGTIIIPYSDPTKCTSTQYFQYSSLQCVDCGNNQVKDVKSLSCICEKGYKYEENNGGPTIVCQACAAREVASTNGWNCVKCQNDNYDALTKTCTSCLSGQSVVERKEDGTFYTEQRKQCITCIQGTQPSSEDRACKPCNQNVISITTLLGIGPSCKCPVGVRPDGTTISEKAGVCFSSAVTELISDPIMSPSVDSAAYYNDRLIVSQALCKKYQNFTACQMLANLCVIHMYLEDNYDDLRLATTDACKEYRLIVASYTGTYVGPDWPSTMPWLYYITDTAVEVLDKTDITMKFERLQKMKFIFVSYAANGTFLGITNDSSVLHMCSISNDISENANMFTTTYKSECKIKLTKLLNSFETIFYDMYLFLDDEKLYPVPVLVENLKFKGSFVNQNSDRSSWRLGRRFFLVDNRSGRAEEGITVVEHSIQYANKMELLYRLRDDGLLYPPLLKINYVTAKVSPDSSSDAALSYEVSYEMTVDSIERNIEIAVGVLSVLGIIYATIRIMSWRRRHGTLMLDCTSFIVFIVYLFSALALVFVAVLVGACVQWLFFFKQQTTVIRFLPTDSQQGLIKGLFIAAFIMKTIDVMFLLFNQIYVEIFFVDWERPRGAVSMTEDGGNKNISTPVSIMRTLFVANEWQEIQTIRRIKPTLQIILVLFFFKVAGFEYWTTTDPMNRLSIDSDVDYVGEPNFCLRFAVISLLYVVIAVIQWLLFGIVYERFVGDAIGDFIDFCSMSNISVFLMPQLHYGYYIHGRSVHGRSDTSLHELYEQFQREEDNLCGKRGLEANTEMQTFEIALSSKFRNEYAKIVLPLLRRDIQQGRHGQRPARQNPGLPGSSLSPALEQSVLAYNSMNRFLSSFLEHAIRDNDYVVQDKFLLERLLKNELQPPLDKSIFYNDEGRSFTNILLYGQEWSLLIFNLLLFAMIDWISSWNSVLAAVCAYFVDVVIVTLRDSFGKKNLASKTMVLDACHVISSNDKNDDESDDGEWEAAAHDNRGAFDMFDEENL